MVHLKIVGNHPTDSTDHPAQTGQAAGLSDCCPISAADEFSYRNPGVLGQGIVSTGRAGIDYARDGDSARMDLMLASLSHRAADAAALDDHAHRHLITAILLTFQQEIAYAQYRHLDPLDEHDADTGPFEDYAEDFWDAGQARVEDGPAPDRHRQTRCHRRTRTPPGALRADLHPSTGQSRHIPRAERRYHRQHPTRTSRQEPKMTHFHSPHADTPITLGHAIIALDRLIVRDLDDRNYAAADKSIAVLDDIATSIEDLTDTDARHVLTGALKALAIRHDVTRENTTLPDIPSDIFVAGTPCGHHHRIGNYADGCAYAAHITWATTAATDGDHTKAQQHAQVADRTLWPLADIDNPNSLRDFIAGIASGFESHLRSQGVPQHN